MKKYIFLLLLLCTSIHTMDQPPEFEQFDPAHEYPLPNGWRLQLLPKPFSANTSPIDIVLLPPGATQIPIAGPPARHGPRPVELDGASNAVIKGIDAFNNKIALCRENGVATFVSLDGEGGFCERQIAKDEDLIACYFTNEHTLVFIGRNQMYQFDGNTATITKLGPTQCIPAIDEKTVAIKKQETHAIAPHARRRRPPMGCWRMLLWLLCGRRPFR